MLQPSLSAARSRARSRDAARRVALGFVEEGRNVLAVVEDTNHVDGALCWSVEDGERKRGKDRPANVAVCRVRGRPTLTESGERGQPIEHVLKLEEKAISSSRGVVVEIGSMLSHILLRPGSDDEVEGHARLRVFFARARRWRASSARRASHQAALTGSEGPEAKPSANSAST